MELDASIVERLEKLRLWQAEQQNRLLKQQQVQREVLTHGKERLYKALGISGGNLNKLQRDEDLLEIETKSDQCKNNSIEVPNLNLDLKDNEEEINAVREELLMSTDVSCDNSVINVSEDYVRHDGSNINYDKDLNLNGQDNMINGLIVPSLELKSCDEFIISPRYKSYVANKDHLSPSLNVTPQKQKMRVPEFFMEGVEPLEKPLKNPFAIDELPVPSPKKDFQTLLEERLKDYETSPKTDTNKNVKPKIKKPFLKKGEGLARFRMSPNSRVVKKAKPRSKSSSPDTRLGPKANQVGRQNAYRKEKSKPLLSINSKTRVATDLSHQKLNLKNVPPPRNICNKSESQINVKHETNERSDVTESDLDSRTQKEMEEVRIFELLEEKAENSSFCSTSSAVIAFLQQTTPFKVKSNARTIRENKLKIRDVEQDDKTEQVEEQVASFNYVRNLNHSQLQQNQMRRALSKYIDSYWESPKTRYSKHSQRQITQTLNYVSSEESFDQHTVENKIRKFSVDTSLHNKSEVNNVQECNEDNDPNISLHVRFAEYNEYKTIGLTDTSSISQGSSSTKDFLDEKAWSDCTTGSSDTEILSPTFERIQSCEITENLSPKERDKLVESHETECVYDSEENFENVMWHKESLCACGDDVIDNEEFETFKTNSLCSEEEASILKPHSSIKEEFMDNKVKCHASQTIKRKKSNASTNTCLTSCTENNPKKVDSENLFDKTVFKSELLKTRLEELEKEIDIFRKENAALSLQRKKLKEDYSKLRKEFKIKEADFEETRRKTEEHLQEERKKLQREKTALESRLRDSQEKALQNRLERQQIQNLKEQLDALKEEMSNKESRWNAAQSRHRSQVRILRVENSKLKEELEKLQNAKKSNKGRKSNISSNAKAIHQINKEINDKTQSIKSRNDSSDDDKFLQPMISMVNAEHNTAKLKYKNPDNTDLEDNQNEQYKALKLQQTMENIAKKKMLYENLLKEATSEYITDCRAKTTNFVNTLSTEDTGYTQKNDNKIRNKVEKTDKTKKLYSDQNVESSSPVGHSGYSDNNPLTSILHSRNNECIQHSSSTNDTQKNVKTSLALFEKSPESEKGSSTSCQSSETNQQTIKHIRHTDGRTEHWYANGNVKKILPDQGLTKMIYYNGDVRETNKEGKVKYFYASTRTWHTTMPDGLEILEFPNGQVERRSPEGIVEISFPDGSIRILKPDGSEKRVSDGTIIETFSNGETILTLPNGQREIHTAAHKRREYPDGTTKLLYPDGTQETRYSNGRVRIKDKDGNLLMDSFECQNLITC